MRSGLTVIDETSASVSSEPSAVFGQLVNYRFRSPYYIVDRLFGAAELRLGGDRGDAVRIERTDGVTRRN